jgi:hypothetical protein
VENEGRVVGLAVIELLEKVGGKKLSLETRIPVSDNSLNVFTNAELAARKHLARLENEAAADGRLRKVVVEVEDGAMSRGGGRSSRDSVSVVHCLNELTVDEVAELESFLLGDGRRHAQNLSLSFCFLLLLAESLVKLSIALL